MYNSTGRDGKTVLHGSWQCEPPVVWSGCSSLSYITRQGCVGTEYYCERQHTWAYCGHSHLHNAIIGVCCYCTGLVPPHHFRLVWVHLQRYLEKYHVHEPIKSATHTWAVESDSLLAFRSSRCRFKSPGVSTADDFLLKMRLAFKLTNCVRNLHNELSEETHDDSKQLAYTHLPVLCKLDCNVTEYYWCSHLHWMATRPPDAKVVLSRKNCVSNWFSASE